MKLSRFLPILIVTLSAILTACEVSDSRDKPWNIEANCLSSEMPGFLPGTTNPYHNGYMLKRETETSISGRRSITEYDYASNSKVIRGRRTHPDSPTSNPVRIEYYLDERGRIISASRAAGAFWLSFSSSYSLEYDDLSRVVNYRESTEDFANFIYDQSLPHRLDKVELFQRSTAPISYQYVYDAQSFLVSINSSRYLSCNEHNQVIGVYFERDSRRWGRIEFSYDENNNLSERKEYGLNGDLGDTVTYEYVTKGEFVSNLSNMRLTLEPYYWYIYYIK